MTTTTTKRASWKEAAAAKLNEDRRRWLKAANTFYEKGYAKPAVLESWKRTLAEYGGDFHPASVDFMQMSRRARYK